MPLLLAVACGGPPPGSPLVRETRRDGRPVTFYYGLRPGHRYALAIKSEPKMPVRLLLGYGKAHLRGGSVRFDQGVERHEVETPHRRVIAAEPEPYTWIVSVNALPRKEGVLTVELWDLGGPSRSELRPSPGAGAMRPAGAMRRTR